LPPVVTAPTFAIRKPAVAVFTLDDYVAKGIMTSDQAGALAYRDGTTNPGGPVPRLKWGDDWLAGKDGPRLATLSRSDGSRPPARRVHCGLATARAAER
jgi:hypothetical protein